MSEMNFWIEGTPATFATAKEPVWKRALARQIPLPSLKERETGLILNFILRSLAPWGHPLDIDNLCEPVFSVLVNQRGWFRGKRPNVQWWLATKEKGDEPGCMITISTEAAPPTPDSSPEWSETYVGPLPSSARSPEVAEWAHRVRHKHAPEWIPQRCALSLRFSHVAINLGDIATGPVKAFVDCLYPLLGGHVGAPEDHRIASLTVAKGRAQQPGDSVSVRLWSDDKVPNSLPSPPASTPSIVPEAPKEQQPRPAGGITNPCRPGTFKWIVCEGALQKKPVAEVRQELERKKSGAGHRLGEYMSDLRSENQLDIRIEGDKMRYYGRR